VSSLRITGFDHLVLRCADVEKTLAFYVDALRLAPVRIEEWRGGTVPFPSARVSAGTIDVETFRMSGERRARFGAQGDGWSVYVYDPDDNAVEIRSYHE
jgi:catechol 2,3-dioxygenase-like lactoylglutathione lyase family enzyme